MTPATCPSCAARVRRAARFCHRCGRDYAVELGSSAPDVAAARRRRAEERMARRRTRREKRLLWVYRVAALVAFMFALTFTVGVIPSRGRDGFTVSVFFGSWIVTCLLISGATQQADRAKGLPAAGRAAEEPDRRPGDAG